MLAVPAHADRSSRPASPSLPQSRSLSSLAGALQAVGARSRSRSKSRRTSLDKAAVPPVPAHPAKRSLFGQRPAATDTSAAPAPAAAPEAAAEPAILPGRRRWKDTRELDLIRAELSASAPSTPIMPPGASIPTSPSVLGQAVDLRAPTDLSRPFGPRMQLAMTSTGNLADSRPLYTSAHGMLSTPTLPRPPRSPARGGRELVTVPAEVMIGLETTPYSVLPLPGSPFASQPSTPQPEMGAFVWPSAPPSPSQLALGQSSQLAVSTPEQPATSPRSSVSGGSVYSATAPDNGGRTAGASIEESWEAPSLDHLPSSYSTHPSEPPAPTAPTSYFPRESTPPTPGKEPTTLPVVATHPTQPVHPLQAQPQPAQLKALAPPLEKSPQGATALSKLRSRAKSWSRPPRESRAKSPVPATPSGKVPAVPTTPAKPSPTSHVAKVMPKPNTWKWGGKAKETKPSPSPSSSGSAPLPKESKAHTRVHGSSIGASAWKALKLPTKEPAAQRAVPPSK